MKFSRHAKNNMRLYKITEQDIMETIESPKETGREDNKLIAVKKFINRFSGYALKVVYEKSGGRNNDHYCLSFKKETLEVSYESQI